MLRLILHYQQSNKDKLTLLLLFNFVSLLLTHTTTKSLNQQQIHTITNFNCQTPTHLFQRYTHAIITWYCILDFISRLSKKYTNSIQQKKIFIIRFYKYQSSHERGFINISITFSTYFPHLINFMLVLSALTVASYACLSCA